MEQAKVDRYANPRHTIWWLLLLVPPGIVWYVFFRIWASRNPNKLRKMLEGEGDPGNADRSSVPSDQEPQNVPQPEPETASTSARSPAENHLRAPDPQVRVYPPLLKDRAVGGFVLSLVGLILCWPLGIWGYVWARKTGKLYTAGDLPAVNPGLVTAGKTLGILCMVALGGFFLLVFIAAVVGAASG